MWQWEVPVETEWEAREHHPPARWIPFQWNQHQTTWKYWGQIMQSWKHLHWWFRAKVFWLQSNTETFAPEISEIAGLKVSSSNKNNTHLSDWISLWKWIRDDRADVGFWASLTLLRTLITWSNFTFDWCCLMNATSKDGTLLHSNSEIEVSNFLDKTRNVWVDEADIESETRNSD